MSKEQKLRNAISDLVVAQCDFSAKELGFADVFEHRRFIEKLTAMIDKPEPKPRQCFRCKQLFQPDADYEKKIAESSPELSINYYHKTKIMGLGINVCKTCFNRKPDNETKPEPSIFSGMCAEEVQEVASRLHGDDALEYSRREKKLLILIANLAARIKEL